MPRAGCISSLAFATTQFSPTYWFICIAPSFRKGKLEEGMTAWKDLAGIVEYGRKGNWTQMWVAPSQSHRSLPRPIAQTHCPWVLQGWGAFTASTLPFYFLHPPVPATTREWCACWILSSGSGKRPFHLCPVVLLPAFCILHRKEMHFAAPL